MGRKVGSFLEQVLESELYNFPDKKTAIKIKVDFDLTKPIKAGNHISSFKDGVCWVDFRYKKLPLF